MKRNTAVKMLMTIVDRNTANEYLDKSCGLPNRELVLSYINYTIIEDAIQNKIDEPEKLETLVDRIKRLRLSKLFPRKIIYG